MGWMPGCKERQGSKGLTVLPPEQVRHGARDVHEHGLPANLHQVADGLRVGVLVVLARKLDVRELAEQHEQREGAVYEEAVQVALVFEDDGPSWGKRPRSRPRVARCGDRSRGPSPRLALPQTRRRGRRPRRLHGRRSVEEHSRCDSDATGTSGRAPPQAERTRKERGSEDEREETAHRRRLHAPVENWADPGAARPPTVRLQRRS